MLLQFKQVDSKYKKDQRKLLLHTLETNYSTADWPQVTLLSSTSSLIILKTLWGCKLFESKTRLFLSFHKFQVVYISKAATEHFCDCGKGNRLRLHHSSTFSDGSSGIVTEPAVQLLTSSQTCLAKGQCKHRWAPVSLSWSQRTQFCSHGQFLASNLSAVKILVWTSSHAKNLCFPSAYARQIDCASKVQ